MSNLVNPVLRPSNNQQSLLGSISLCIWPPLLQSPGENVHLARHSQNHSSLESSPGENSESGFSRTCCTPICDMRIKVLPQDPCSCLLFCFLRSLEPPLGRH